MASWHKTVQAFGLGAREALSQDRRDARGPRASHRADSRRRCCARGGHRRQVRVSLERWPHVGSMPEMAAPCSRTESPRTCAGGAQQPLLGLVDAAATGLRGSGETATSSCYPPLTADAAVASPTTSPVRPIRAPLSCTQDVPIPGGSAESTSRYGMAPLRPRPIGCPTYPALRHSPGIRVHRLAKTWSCGAIGWRSSRSGLSCALGASSRTAPDWLTT